MKKYLLLGFAAVFLLVGCTQGQELISDVVAEESAAAEQGSGYQQISQDVAMQMIYCRSGNRSKQASAKLASMGYTNIYEFGGINTWPGEIVTDGADLSAQNTLQIEVNGETLTATLENNSSADALLDLIGEAPMTLDLEDYSGFEKVGQLQSLLGDGDVTVTLSVRE